MSYETENLVLIVAEKKGGQWIRKDAGKIRRLLNDTYKGVRDTGRDLRESVSPMRWISEKVFSGFGEQMEALREVDDQIQNWTHDLDNCLDRAEDAKKQGKILDVVFWLSQINNRLGLVSSKGKELSNLHEKDLAEFYGQTDHGVQEDYFTSGEGKIVEAGIIDGLGRRITNWKMQQMYRKRLADQNRAVKQLLSSATMLVNKVENRLAIMSKARANGDIARYMAAITDISKQQAQFEAFFRQQFDAHFSQLVEALKRREKEIAENQAQGVPPTVDMVPETEDMPQDPPEAPPPIPQTIPAEPYFAPESDALSTPTPQPQPQVPAESNGPAGMRDPVLVDMNQESEPTGGEMFGPAETIDVNQKMLEDKSQPAPQPAPQAKQKGKGKKKEDKAITMRSAEFDMILLKKSHSDFYRELNKAASLENPVLLAQMMSKYSEQIEDLDPETSDELLTLAEAILNV